MGKLETYLHSLELKEINPLLIKLSGTKSAFQKLQLINSASDSIFSAVCNSMKRSAYRDYAQGFSGDRTCAARLMGYFNNELPLPSPKALGPHLDELEGSGPLGAACLYAYYKQNQVPLLCEGIREHQSRYLPSANNTTAQGRLSMFTFTCILRYSRNATLSELFSKGFDPNHDLDHPFLLTFIKLALKPMENLHPDLTLACPKLSYPVRSFSIPALWEYTSNTPKNLANLKAFIGEDANPELGINGEINLYGLDPNHEQLLEDFKTLCSLPEIDLHVKDEEGKTPLEIAESLEMYDVAEILKIAITKQNFLSKEGTK